MIQRSLLWSALLAILILIPQILGTILTNMVVEFAISAVFAVSLNLLLSYTGLLSFGHALFFGTGAYATALALTHLDGLPLIPALLAGGLAAMSMAAICSPLLVRVGGTAFAMLTLAFGQLMYVVCLKYREITGGEDGIAGFPVPPFRFSGISINLSEPANFYYFAVAVAAGSIWIMWYLTRTPVGSLMIGIGDNFERVGYLGFHVAQTKAIVFVISGTFAGIAGSLFALFQNVVSTDGVLHILISFYPVMAVLVGGIGSFSGPIVGAGFLLLVEEGSSRLTERIELVTGLIFVAVVLFAPAGVVGLWKRIHETWRPHIRDGAGVGAG